MKVESLFATKPDNYMMRFVDDGKAIDYGFAVEGDRVAVRELALREILERLDEETVQNLYNCVLCFHQAQDSFKQEIEPVSVEQSKKDLRPICMMMQEKNVDEAADFVVSFETDDSKIDYVFEVTKSGPLPGVGWEHQFFRDLLGELDLAKPLFDSILSFYAFSKAIDTKDSV